MRSSTLALLAERCPAALDHLDAGTPHDRDGFAAGIAAHAILQAVGMSRDRDAEGLAHLVCLRLASHGRAFDGLAEPPLPLEASLEGRRLALDWISRHGLPPEGACYEHALAVGPDWQPVPWSREAWWRGAVDATWTEDCAEEESQSRILVVRDWKSSWAQREEQLDSLQLHGYACLALAHADPMPDAIRLEIAHLRATTVYARTVWLDYDGLGLLDVWREEIRIAIEAAERWTPGQRPARPGAGCHGCPYLTHCTPAREALGVALTSDLADLAQAAQDYAVVDAWHAHLATHLRAALAARPPVAIQGGTVGYHPASRRSRTEETAGRLCDAWGVTDSRSRGLVAAIDPSVTAVERVARLLHPGRGGDPTWREDRAALVEACVDAYLAPVFGVSSLAGVEDTP